MTTLTSFLYLYSFTLTFCTPTPADDGDHLRNKNDNYIEDERELTNKATWSNCASGTTSDMDNANPGGHKKESTTVDHETTALIHPH